ncbi:MAG: NAD(P) transhydrogenase subunit alpha [Candidatus Izemoplasmatales bacterium]|jgi:NAD(P) transhydrogenase subunit alpha|nr:NAD(P) transhydrogenase subunit alpha [Candidatus Izemoplasmatales bacterium]MDD3865776.1 NAD(P) transhydrogenase subunit alpha [Candidatus Izemoplasmatales bacterium]
MEYILLGVFVVATIGGYFLINNVPSLLHTPLMSGMNALSGVSVIGALVAVSVVLKANNSVFAVLIGAIAIIAAMVNVVAGFTVTDRMLKMFARKGIKHE